MTSDAVMTDGVLRQVRALTLASVLFASGLVGHAAAGGVTPGTSVLVPLFVLTAALVAAFAPAPMGPARAVALLAGGQGLLHAALQLLGGTTVPAPVTMCGAASDMAAMSSPTSSHMMMHHCAAASGDSALSGLSGGHSVMLLAHLAAAAVAGAWLAVGERAFWTLLTLATRPVLNAWRIVTELLRSGVGTAVANRPALQLGWGIPSAIRDSRWAVGAVTRRGPPVTASPEPHTYAAALTV
jgi:hypothetical protein